MPLNSFTPNTKIKSSETNDNNTNFSNHCRNVNLSWFFPSVLFTQTSKNYLSLPDNVTWERVDLIADTAPVGAAVIVDIERSVDGGANWVTIFTGGTNRPQVADGQKTGNTQTIDVPAGTKLTHYYRAKISQIGSTTPGADLTVMFRGKYNFD